MVFLGFYYSIDNAKEILKETNTIIIYTLGGKVKILKKCKEIIHDACQRENYRLFAGQIPDPSIYRVWLLWAERVVGFSDHPWNNVRNYFLKAE